MLKIEITAIDIEDIIIVSYQTSQYLHVRERSHFNIKERCRRQPREVRRLLGVDNCLIEYLLCDLRFAFGLGESEVNLPMVTASHEA